MLEVNPAEISSLRQPLDIANHHWARGTKCIVVMTNGTFIATSEDCPTVVNKVQQAK